jgi:hypothetical protein
VKHITGLKIQHQTNPALTVTHRPSTWAALSLSPPSFLRWEVMIFTFTVNTEHQLFYYYTPTALLLLLQDHKLAGFRPDLDFLFSPQKDFLILCFNYLWREK